MKFFSNTRFRLRIKFSPHIVLYVLCFLFVAFLLTHNLFATTPNPGHPWTQVGDGTFAVTGPTTFHTYTFPDATSTVLTTNAAVTVTQGGTGLASFNQGDMVYASGANTLSALAKNTSSTSYLSNTGTSNNPAWSQVNLTNGITGLLGLADGGLNANLTASNGGIVYSTASAGAILAATSTAGLVLQSGASAAPSWSLATYPSTAGTSGNYLESNGTNFASTTPPSASSILTIPLAPATGAVTAVALATSLTTRDVGLFYVPVQITINQLSFITTIGGTTPSFTIKACIYSSNGSTKLLDVTSAAQTASANVSITVSPAVTLTPGEYYIAIGEASESGTSPTLGITSYTTTSVATLNGAGIPSGKLQYEGTVAHTSGTCNSTLGTISNANSKTPVVRLDN